MERELMIRPSMLSLASFVTAPSSPESDSHDSHDNPQTDIPITSISNAHSDINEDNDHFEVDVGDEEVHADDADGYDATVLFDFSPPSPPALNELPAPIPLRAGESVRVFGSKLHRPPASLSELLADVDFAGAGWCVVRRSDARSGLAPIAFLQFQEPEKEPHMNETKNDLQNDSHKPNPFQASMSGSLASLSLNRARVSSSALFITSFPAPPQDSSDALAAVDYDSKQNPQSEDMNLPAHPPPTPPQPTQPSQSSKQWPSLQSAWKSITATSINPSISSATNAAASAIRNFVLSGPSLSSAFASAIDHQTPKNPILSTAIYNNHANAHQHVSDAHSIMQQQQEPPSHPNYAIEPVANNAMHWLALPGPSKSIIHSPHRKRTVVQHASDTHTNVLMDAFMPTSHEFVMFKITTNFGGSSSQPEVLPVVESENSSTADSSITVERRYNDFCFLHAYLHAIFPPGTLVCIPPKLPPKHLFSSRFNLVHIQDRMRALQLFLDQVVRHPILCSLDIVIAFLRSGGIEETLDVDSSITSDSAAMWSLDRASPVAAVADGAWCIGFEIPRSKSLSSQQFANAILASLPSSSSQGQTQPSTESTSPRPDNIASSFYQHITVPPSARYNGLSMSTFRLRTAESITDNLLSLLHPLIDAASRHETQNRDARRIVLDLAQAMQSTGRLLSCTGGDQAGCWIPKCHTCGPIGDAMISASLQLKHVAEIHGSHGVRSARILSQYLDHLRATLAPIRTLTAIQRAATESATQAAQQDPELGHPSIAASSSSHSPFGMFNNTGRFKLRLPTPPLSPSLSHRQPNQPIRHSYHTHHQQEAERRAATVLAVAESESRQAHVNKTVLIESMLSTWLTTEIDKHERILKRLKAAKDVFREPIARE